ncbi:DUF6177 family protein [Nocardiopsis sp. NRRL B-16309]|uniref:DUF6177 family protein n=1 Tax=Nocardiopsis sp. NRRL B-16309 TaxID=1519494 RepID=UPI0006B02893|nr:DUF6177 family protein [Nocardiopsis sp. NRRL B-16309]KOX15972.1 hypothetical protein ADL05_13300 [Nocardiopsis sp. NRRL B-16309]
MSHDVIALLAESPDRRSLLDALAQAGPKLRVRLVAEGAVVQLRDGSGRLVLAVQAAQRLAVSSEADRLLADGVSDDLPAQPYWVEARGAELDDTDTTGMARRFARHLVERHGGTLWEPESRLPRDDAHLVGVTDHPAVTAVTGKNAVVVQDRPVVSLSNWLVDALAVHGRDGLGLQVVTPSTSVLTHALRSFLGKRAATWVVRAPDGRYYDGFNGLPLVWADGTGFVPDPGLDPEDGPNEAFRVSPDDEPVVLLHVDLQIDHAVRGDLELGGTVEELTASLAGVPPSVWGTAEPLTRPWDRARITRTARGRAPGRTWLAFSGQPGGPDEDALPFAGTLRVSRTSAGVREHVLLTVAHRPGGEPDLDALIPLLRELAAQGGLRTMTVLRALGRADLTTPPRWAGVPVPVGLAVGAEGVLETGRDRALKAPVEGVAYGPRLTPVVWYRIGDGTEPDSWDRFRALMEHLRPREAS